MEYTVKQVAEMLGIKPRTVRQEAENYGLGHKFGDSNLIVFSESDIKVFKNRPHVGNPNWKKK
jgi:hypothetical protein